MMHRWGWVAVVVGTAVLAGCSSDSSEDADDTTTTAASDSSAEPADDVLRILVTNDDGVDAPGIDSLVNSLEDLEGVEVTVVAPAENQSGTGDQTTPDDVEVEDAETASGVKATSVRGYPADSVVWALDEDGVGEEPHVVVSGINFGQNIGNLAQVSGTVGAATTAARSGVPALAVSQGAYGDVENPDFASGAGYAVEWVEENRDDLLAGTMAAGVVSINVPTCVTGSIRGVVEVPTADDLGDREPFEVDCESTLEDPVDDVDALLNGFVTVSTIDIT